MSNVQAEMNETVTEIESAFSQVSHLMPLPRAFWAKKAVSVAPVPAGRWRRWPMKID